MLNPEHKQAVSEQKIEKFNKPIVVLDIDETLILGQNAQGSPVDTINDRLIGELVKCGINEVYLFTAFELSLLKTKAERDEIKPVLRLDLIKHLENKGITVKALISNHDLLLNAPEFKDVAEVKKDWMSLKANLGQYYNTFIQPQEERVRQNPEINLGKDENYKKIITQQKQNTPFIHKIMDLYKIKNIKSPLSDLLFALLKKEGVSTQTTILFMDDRMQYIEAMAELAKQHGFKFDSLQIKKPYEQNYAEFLESFYPLLEYQNLVVSLKSKLQASRDSLPQALPKFLFFGDSQYVACIQEPITMVLTVFDKVIKDFEKNFNRHDCIGACNAMIKELIKRQTDLEGIKEKLPAQEQKIAEKIIHQFSDAVSILGKIRTSLAIHYQVEFNPMGKMDQQQPMSEKPMSLSS